jgi:cell division protein FtsZ
VVTALADPAANIIFGAVVDDKYTGEVHVTIIATGFSQTFQKTLIDPKAARQEQQEAANAAKEVDSPWKRPAPVSSRFPQGLGSKGFL